MGGNRKVEMPRLAQTFNRLKFTQVKTFIASGNVIFCSDENDRAELIKQIEVAIEHDFGFPVPVLLRSLPEIAELVKDLPNGWVNDATMRCDVMFLQPEIDSPAILKQFPFKSAIEDVVYFPGVVVWRIDRDNVRRGAVPRIIGTGIYRRLTIRNANSVRKICTLMQMAASQNGW